MIKDHAQAIEILSNCIPYFENVKSIDFSKERFITFNWYGENYLLDLESLQVHRITGHIFQSNPTCLLIKALIKKQIELNSKS